MSVLSRRSATADARRATEQALLDATVALLEEGRAFAEISIEQIVRGAGVSRPTFYSYFRDKRALILELGEGVRQALIQSADPWLDLVDDDVEHSLAALLRTYQRYASTVRALMEAATYDEEVAAFWRVLHDGFLPRVEQRILASVPDIPDDQAHARAYSLVWMTERVLSEHTARPTVTESALLRQLAWVWTTSTSDIST
ncbi:TetR/AcrR family transcriptional regulator [Patulibacter minatonensis]|uniref:TetR/AcrR family transcriptional regulator n=1 Tax=Patulibacter minatonensis TaxID=298163 RepID=UPI00047DA873|nr:TetR/AcrR family transcriptional regulator [Patulibacter minatonensis]